ncbi:unnamed protein product, partial [Protopolystoma xenopodis]
PPAGVSLGSGPTIQDRRHASISPPTNSSRPQLYNPALSPSRQPGSTDSEIASFNVNGTVVTLSQEQARRQAEKAAAALDARERARRKAVALSQNPRRLGTLSNQLTGNRRTMPSQNIPKSRSNSASSSSSSSSSGSSSSSSSTSGSSSASGFGSGSGSGSSSDSGSQASSPSPSNSPGKSARDRREARVPNKANRLLSQQSQQQKTFPGARAPSSGKFRQDELNRDEQQDHCSFGIMSRKRSHANADDFTATTAPLATDRHKRPRVLPLPPGHSSHHRDIQDDSSEPQLLPPGAAARREEERRLRQREQQHMMMMSGQLERPRSRGRETIGDRDRGRLRQPTGPASCDMSGPGDKHIARMGSGLRDKEWIAPINRDRSSRGPPCADLVIRTPHGLPVADGAYSQRRSPHGRTAFIGNISPGAGPASTRPLDPDRDRDRKRDRGGPSPWFERDSRQRHPPESDRSGTVWSEMSQRTSGRHLSSGIETGEHSQARRDRMCREPELSRARDRDRDPRSDWRGTGSDRYTHELEILEARRAGHKVFTETDIADEEDEELARRRRDRARSRTRGPRGDTVEPFGESTSLATEKRLNELRQRLNMVDDAIAEIRAGTEDGN